MYTPDFWCILKIGGDDPHYRVFGSWAGGYTYGSSWRMNSGITKMFDAGDCYIIHGVSGSIYQCHKKMYGCHYQSQGTRDWYVEKSEGKITIMPEDTDWSTIDWIIS